MPRPYARSQSDAFHASQYAVPSNVSDLNAGLPSHSYGHTPDTSKDMSETLSNPYACSRSQLHENRDVGSSYASEQSFDRRNVIGPELLSSSVTYRQLLDNPTRPALSAVAQMKRNESALGMDTFSLAMQSPESGPVSASSVASSDSWVPTAIHPTQERVPDPPKPKKRREKPRIELAPDQPPTTQGKPRARVYVACIQW